MTDQELWTKAYDLYAELERLDYKYVGYSLKDVASKAEDRGDEDTYYEAQELSGKCWELTNEIDEIEDKHADVWENAHFTADERDELQSTVTEMESWKEEIEGFLYKHCEDR